MITIQCETYLDAIKELRPLFEEHWEEVAINKEKIKLNPDYSKYEQMQASGILALFTARDEGRLIGYSVFFMIPHMHYRDHMFAMNDIIFLLPEYRGTMAGADLVQFAEKELKGVGVSYITYHFKTHLPFGKGLEFLGYEHCENMFGKYIEK